MSEKIIIQPELAEAIIDLVEELASEIDLYYEDADIVAARPAITKMQRCVDMLAANGYAVPETFTHVVGRFQRSVN